jgi:hypothetical protein
MSGCCGGSRCYCRFEAGDGIAIEGSGWSDDPAIISAELPDLSDYALKTDLDPYALLTDLAPYALDTDLVPLAKKSETAPRDYTVPTSGVGTWPGVAHTGRRLGSNGLSRSSGVMYATAIVLEAGQVVRGIMFSSSSSSAATTVRKFGLYSGAYSLLRSTADDSVNTWGSNTNKTLALTSAYTVPTTGLYYVAVLEAGTTVSGLYALGSVTNTIDSIPPFPAWQQSALADLPATATPSTSGTQTVLYAVATGDPA